MSRHYSTRSFFRQVPGGLLARYFKGRGLFGELDVARMGETGPEALLAAWGKLPEHRRRELEAEFRQVFEMSSEKGIRTLLDEARRCWPEGSEEIEGFIETLSSQPGHFHRAMAALLDHRECWTRGARHYHPQAAACWRKRKHLGHRPAATDAASLEYLADLIRTYYHRSEGRGNHCLVESFHRGGLDHYFAYPEDYSRQEIEWVDGTLGLRPHRPAFEVVFVYSQREGSLDLSCPGPYRVVEPLQEMFAKAILKLDRLPDRPTDSRVYDLDPLLRRSFEFAYGADSGIEAVAVRNLRLSSRAGEGSRISAEAESSSRPEALHDLLDSAGRSFESFGVTRAELVARVAAGGGESAGTFRILLAGPASCSLDYGERGRKLRAMLEDSGLEPRGIETRRNRSPKSLLLDLGARLCASPGRTVRIAPRELDRWPEEAVRALKAQKILRRAGPSRGAVCPGCERQCPMPVHGPEGPSGGPESGSKPSTWFIVCDKREDTHRVPVPADSLPQWEMNANMLGRFVAGRLSLRWEGTKPEGKDLLEIGIAGKGKRRRMLSLRTEGQLRLVAGSSELDLSRVLRFREGSYELEESVIHRWLNAAKDEEAPYSASRIRSEARKLNTRKKYKDWQRAYRTLKRRKPGMSDVWYARQIAKSDLGGGLSPETIRKRMKK